MWNMYSIAAIPIPGTSWQPSLGIGLGQSVAVFYLITSHLTICRGIVVKQINVSVDQYARTINKLLKLNCVI